MDADADARHRSTDPYLPVVYKVHPLLYPLRCACGAFAAPVQTPACPRAGRCTSCRVDDEFKRIVAHI